MFLVKEYDYRYRGVIGEYLFRTEEGARAKVKEILEADRELNSYCYEDIYDFEEFVKCCFEDEELDEVFSVDKIEFEEDKERGN